jgi:hypothetical protein
VFSQQPLTAVEQLRRTDVIPPALLQVSQPSYVRCKPHLLSMPVFLALNRPYAAAAEPRCLQCKSQLPSMPALLGIVVLYCVVLSSGSVLLSSML